MAFEETAAIAPVQTAESATLGKRLIPRETLGSVRHRHEHTNELILIPTPSNDPNDPLNWPQWFKWYTAIVICLAMFMCNLLAAGPTVAMLETAVDFFPNRNLNSAIARTAYFFNCTALLQGTSNFFWMPLVNKYGRRPVYIASYVIYLVSAIWAAFTYSYGSFLAARIVMGFGAGAAETMAPISIADIFFLHERGLIMSMYTAALSCGVAGGIIIDGGIVAYHHWRYIYYVAIALIGALLLVAFFTFPETAYRRVGVVESPAGYSTSTSVGGKEEDVNGGRTDNLSNLEDARPVDVPKKKSYLQNLSLFSGRYTEEKFWTLFIRPFTLIILPPVLWSTLVQSVTIGFLVAVTSNVASAYNTAYGFAAWQTGLCFFSAIIGSLLGIAAGGSLSDKIADWFTVRNGGLREPEMRLPAMFLSLFSAPLGLLLYGVGIQDKLHWMCPTVGLGLLNFSIVYCNNIALVYTIDAYRPIVGEVTVTTMAFKSAFGFLLSFYTNPWVVEVGYLNAYGAMAGISAAVLIFFVPMYFFGKRIRHRAWHWKVVRYVHWDEDREVGE